MLWIEWTLAVALGVALLAWITGQVRLGLVEVRTEVEIAAPTETVWKVVSDLGAYSDWNPNLTEVRGALAPGARVDFQAVVSGTRRPLDARIEVVEPLRRLVWVGPSSSLRRILFWGEHRFELEPLPDGRTRFVNRESFGGLAALPLAGYLRDDVVRAYRDANGALRERAEARVAADGVRVAAFVRAYQAAWASREPGVMAGMWHADGELHHPALSEPIPGSLVPANNDGSKALEGFEWTLLDWAAAGDVVYLHWRSGAVVDGQRHTWTGVDRMQLRGARIAREDTYFDTAPLRRALDPNCPLPALVDVERLRERAR